MTKKYVYHFEEAYGLGKELLGGKGAGLAEMTHIGVPIPQGFTITTEACTLYYDGGKKLPESLIKDVYTAQRGNHLRSSQQQRSCPFRPSGSKNRLQRLDWSQSRIRQC